MAANRDRIYGQSSIRGHGPLLRRVRGFFVGAAHGREQRRTVPGVSIRGHGPLLRRGWGFCRSGPWPRTGTASMVGHPFAGMARSYGGARLWFLFVRFQSVRPINAIY